MANPVKGEVPLVLADGRRFTIVLDMEALVEAETIYGKPMAQMLADMNAGFLGAQGAVLQGALIRHHPRVTRAEALEMFRTDADACGEAMTEAVKASFPDTTPGRAEGNAPAQKAPGGKRSGRSGAKRG